MSSERFLFCSPLALDPVFLRVAELIAREHDLDGHVLAPEEFPVSPVRHPAGMLSQRGFDASSTPLAVHFLPARKGRVVALGFQEGELKALLRAICPDYVWLHAQFWEGLVHQFLWNYRFHRHPRIVAYAAVNNADGGRPLVSARWPFLSRTRLLQIALWGRLDGVAACATKAMECARSVGLPPGVPAVVNYLPVLGPDSAGAAGVEPPWHGNGAVTIGFAGYLSEQKGWKVLLASLERLPERFKAVIAGDGEQREELQSWLDKPKLKGRVHYAGLLTRSQLLATYREFDVFVLPSVTTPAHVEQFGCVLAEAMACGVPVVGSDSGAIPETVGEAGLVVPEGDPVALAEAILRVSSDDELRRRAVRRGLDRFQSAYSCQAYARSMAGLLGLNVRSAPSRPAPAANAYAESAPPGAAAAAAADELRVLYLPFYEDMPSLRCRSLAGVKQRRQKRGLREALSRVGQYVEVDYLRVLKRHGPKGLARAIRDAAAKLQPNLVLSQVQGTEALQASDVQALRGLTPGARWVNWNGDYRDPETWRDADAKLMSQFDLQLVVCHDAARAYERRGTKARYWQSAWEPDGVGHEPTPRTPRHDVLFQANGYSSARRQLVQRLRDAGVNLGLYGKGWPLFGAVGNTHYDFRKGCRLIRAAKMVLADNQWARADGFASDRLFCSLAAGGALLLHQQFKGQEKLGFVDGEHLVNWADADDLVRKLRFWLQPENDARRRAIASAGHKFCLANHSFDVRVRELLRIFDELGWRAAGRQVRPNR